MQQRALLFLALAAAPALGFAPARRFARAPSALAAGAAPPSQVKFSKYHGLGNDFILVDDRASKAPSISPAQAMALCDRNFGVGGDGVIFVLPGDGVAGVDASGDYTMRIYNSDGSEPEMCGNGIRCMARYITSELEGRASDEGATYTIATLAGPIVPVVKPGGVVTVDMGEPELRGPEVPTTLAADAETGRVLDAPLELNGQSWAVTCVSMGNPHAVVFVDDLDALAFETVGPLFESDPAFPARVNAEFVQVLSPTHLRMKVWERGAGPTLACGTGACALVVAAVLTGRAERTCKVTLPGGDLEIEWREADNRIYMTGPAEFTFSGSTAIEA